MIATTEGYAKRTDIDDFPEQARGGAGVKAAKVDKARGLIAAVAPANADEVAFMTADGAVVVTTSSIRAAARDGGGSKVAGVSGPVLRVLPLAARDDD